MTLDETYLSAILNGLFQKRVVVEINGKKIKDGIFLLYKQNGPHIQLTISQQTDAIKNSDVIEIPFPFATTSTESTLVFDYNIKHIAKTQQVQLLAAKIAAATPTRCKFHNSVVTIAVQQ